LDPIRVAKACNDYGYSVVLKRNGTLFNIGKALLYLRKAHRQKVKTDSSSDADK
jgi:hypothetical protein